MFFIQNLHYYPGFGTGSGSKLGQNPESESKFNVFGSTTLDLHFKMSLVSLSVGVIRLAYYQRHSSVNTYGLCTVTADVQYSFYSTGTVCIFNLTSAKNALKAILGLSSVADGSRRQNFIILTLLSL